MSEGPLRRFIKQWEPILPRKKILDNSLLGEATITPCDVCGSIDPTWDRDWWVSDEEWKHIVPKEYQNKTLCPWCFIEFALKKGERYEVHRMPTGGVDSVRKVKIQGEQRAGEVTIYEADAELEALKSGKVEEWRRRGHSESLIKMALELADEWTESMVSAWAPPEYPEVKKAMAKKIYPKGLETADRWIVRIGESVKASVIE